MPRLGRNKLKEEEDMSAIFPDVYIRRQSTRIEDFGAIDGNLLEGWDRLENALKGAKFSIEKALVKQMSNGNERVISEKVMLEMSVIFTDKTKYDYYRDEMVGSKLMNTPVDLLFYDSNKAEFLAAFWDINLTLKGNLESGDSYVITFASEAEGEPGSHYKISGREPFGILSGVVYESVSGLPYTNRDITVKAEGTYNNIEYTYEDAVDGEGIYLLNVICSAEGTTYTITESVGIGTFAPNSITAKPNQETPTDLVITLV